MVRRKKLKRGYVYVLKGKIDDQPVFKIGHTTNLKQRLAAHKTTYSDLTLLKTYQNRTVFEERVMIYAASLLAPQFGGRWETFHLSTEKVFDLIAALETLVITQTMISARWKGPPGPNAKEHNRIRRIVSGGGYPSIDDHWFWHSFYEPENKLDINA